MTWVHERIFAAGGSHIPHTWAEFSDQTGVNAIVHLNPSAPLDFSGSPPEAFLWLSMQEETEADLSCRWLAGHFVQRQLREGRSVLLHCRAGRHRTRWVFVAYLLLQGKSWRAALRQAEQRPWLAPYHTDPAVWRAFADWLEVKAPDGARRSA